MKIATITCHDVYNYGASLQAYALQEYCKSLGCEYEIIDYKPPYMSNDYNLYFVANPLYDRPIIKQLYLLAKLPGRIMSLKRKRRFDKFKEDYLQVTDTRYSSSDDIAAKRPEADLYIAGSDQIWNTFFLNGRDKAFYLDFARGHGRLISYAASFATDKIYNNLESKVAKWLNNFDAISVRENSSIDLLIGLGRMDGIVVCDPVFLLDKKQWTDLANKSEYRAGYDDYIFLYDCERSRKLKDVAKSLSKMTGCKIVSVSDTYGRYADKYFALSGPLEFLKLISESRYVVANSFHALAFSLIFNKPFFIVNRTEGINARMRDFLDYLSLSSRLIDNPEQLTLKKIDYDNVMVKLSVLIDNSKQFLTEQTFF